MCHFRNALTLKQILSYHTLKNNATIFLLVFSILLLNFFICRFSVDKSYHI
jgi:hypothetical protein